MILKGEIINANEIELFFIFGILFEKRVNLSDKSLFEISYYDLEKNKTYTFKDYLFIKEHKCNLVKFFNTLNSINLFSYFEYSKPKKNNLR